MENVHKNIQNLQFRLRGYLDLPNEAIAKRISSELQQLEDAAQNKQNPRSLEDRVKRLIQMLDEGEQMRIMDHAHSDDMRDKFESLRNDIRKLS